MEKFKISNRRYLGSKAKLISFIKEIIEKECGNISSFTDLFAGTGVVGWNFNNENISVIVNDLLESNYLIYQSFFGYDLIDLKKLNEIINGYNDININDDNYFSTNFADTYFNLNNCRKIGFIRDDIEAKYKSKEINERERAYLITSLMYAMDKIANTVGHYDAFRLCGDFKKTLFLEELEIPTNRINKNNLIYKENANDLVRKINSDVVYIDPPYNSRQYCDAYHLLENIALWEKPEVKGVAKKMDRSIQLKSQYCLCSAPEEFDDLIQNINAKFILVSYNNTGKKGAGRSQAKISDYDIIKSLSKRGEVKIFETNHLQYTTGKSNFKNHKERVFLCKVDNKYENKSLICNIPSIVKSPLNYTGGKSKLINQLLGKFPKQIGTLIDLFGGGFNVGVNTEANLIIYNDKDVAVTRLIKLFYKYSGDEIISKLEKIIKIYELSDSVKYGYGYYNCSSDNGLGKYNQKKYLKLRADYNELKKNSESKDFALLCLIIYSFNNQIRFNSSGLFNMPVGKRDLNSSMRKNIEYFSQKMRSKKIIFSSKDFDKFSYLNIDKPFFYCDPPYYLGDASYNENNGWNKEYDLKLFSFLDKLNELNIPFALSNVIEHKGIVNKHLKKWVDDNCYNLIYLKADYSNSNYHKKDKNLITKEILVTNY